MPRATCWDTASAAGETLPGKAPAARRWVLVERAGPWPPRAEDAAPPEVLEQVAGLGSARLALIRRRRTRPASSAVRVVDTLDVLSGAEPMFLVCVHAVRDGCCGRLGNPVASALSRRHPELTWETTHIGGHRLAANLVCL